ncbi:hypothetical protein [Thaumasiovibrio subtropicus]|uniref:hypothetical protein n=1 Tax=Thaumasiovibrio subtropicus TaxID=1891207 RepID=UPI000B34CF1E|nr:hypothetical protein [Thaumasiovibrio subtropicus]
MKQTSFLAMSVALALTGCGGSSGGDTTTPPVAKTFSVTAIDGYLHKAEVAVGDLCETRIGLTDTNGNIDIPVAHQGKKICVSATQGETVDMSRGIVEKSFNLDAPAGSDIVSPMTNMVAAKMAADKTLTEAQAKQQVSEQFTALNVTEDELFGDYIADASAGDKEAQALVSIGETLVDNSELDVEKQLAASKSLAETTSKMIEDGDDLEDFSPIIEAAEDDSITVVANHRPHVALDAPLKDVDIVLGDAFPDHNAIGYFADKDGDQLTLSIAYEDGEAKGLRFENNILTGTPTQSGEFDIHFYATDAHGARSYPVELELTVTSPNQPPVVVEDERKVILAQLEQLDATQGEDLNADIDISNLFDDADDDELKIAVTADIPGVTAAITDDALVLKGQPTGHGNFTITLTAQDGVNTEEATTAFTLAVAKAQVPTTHPLENKTWYSLEWGSDDGDEGTRDYTRVWCDATRLEKGEIFFVERQPSHRTQCSDANMQKLGTYKIDASGAIVATIEFEEDGEQLKETVNITQQQTGHSVAEGAQTILFDTGEDTAERYTWFANAADAERHLKIRSDDSSEDRMLPFILPADESDTFMLGSLSVQMSERTHPNDNGKHDVDLFFDPAEGNTFQCAELLEFYKSAELTGPGIGNFWFDLNKDNCNDVEGTSAGIDFDIYEGIEKGGVYSVIVYPKEHYNGQFVEAVKLNVTWTGQGNTE